MVVAIDYDGTITSNICFYQQLCFMLHKSGHVIILLSGCKPERAEETKWHIKNIGVYHDFIFTRPVDIKTGPKAIGQWKKQMLKEYEVDLWFDNEVKNYEDSGVNYSELNVEIIRA